MSNLPSVGIIGGGFVGSSIAKGFQHYTDTKVYDLIPEKASASLEETIEQDILFICVNTPMKKDGTVDDTAVIAVAEMLRGNLTEGSEGKPVILKSTLPPNNIGQLMLDYGNDFFLIFSPEFLTERSAEYDFNQSNRLIFGVLQGELEGLSNDTAFSKPFELVNTLFDSRFPQVTQHWCRFEEASLVKYFTNVFFATKIALFNEFAQVAEAYDLDANEVIGKFMLDQRVGRSHFLVPGTDGKRGFGGHCFPKDINGFLHIAADVGVAPIVAAAAWIKNLEVRPEEDWKADVGRAVSEEENEDE